MSGAIDSVYYGNKKLGPLLTRSITEAQWLATLDSLKIPFEFEPQYMRFQKPLRPNYKPFRYLPDIYLPRQNLALEIKGTFEGSRFCLTDPRCMWQGQNAELFQEIKECLAEGNLCWTPGPEDYFDVWAIAGRPNDPSVMLFATVEEDFDCYDAHFKSVIYPSYKGGVPRLGVCPNCQNLILFKDTEIEDRQEEDGHIYFDCDLCGRVGFVPDKRWENEQAEIAAANKINFPFCSAANYASHQSAKIVPATCLNEERTLWEYTPHDAPEPLQLTVAPDPYTPRRVSAWNA